MPDVEHVAPLPRPGGRKLFPSHRLIGWHRRGGIPAWAQLVAAGALLGFALAPLGEGGRQPLGEELVVLVADAVDDNHERVVDDVREHGGVACLELTVHVGGGRAVGPTRTCRQLTGSGASVSSIVKHIGVSSRPGR